MQDTSINECFHDRIEFAESLFRKSTVYENSLSKWSALNILLEELLQKNGYQKEILQLEDLFQELTLGAARYGYMTGYQDAKHSFAEAKYQDFIERQNSDYVKPSK